MPDRRLAPLVVSFTDDPEVVREAATEDYTTHVVPLSWRSSKKSLSMAWYSLVSGMFYLVTAATLAGVVGVSDALIGIVLACLAFGAFGAVISAYAARTGLTAALLSQRLFGSGGSVVAPLILAATSIYYATFESSMIAHAFDAYIGGLDIRIWYAIAVVMNLPLVMGSIRRWMDKYNAVLLPIYWAGLVLVVALLASRQHPTGWLGADGAATELAAPGWLFAFFVYLGVLVLMMFTVDFARFGRPGDARTNAILVFGPVFYVFVYLANGLIGIYVAHSAGLTHAVSSTAIVETIVTLMGGWGLALVWVTQARINTANFYVAATNLEAMWTRLFRTRLPRMAAVLVSGALTYVLMLTDVLEYLIVALAWQGAFISAWTGILLAHLALSPRGDAHGQPEIRAGRLRRWTMGAWVWFACSLTGIAIYEYGGAVGSTWSTPLTFIISATAYVVTSQLSRRSDVLHRADDPRDEVQDIWAARIRCHACERSYVAVEMDRDPSKPGKPAICAACSTTSTDYRRAAMAEARAAQKVPESMRMKTASSGSHRGAAR